MDASVGYLAAGLAGLAIGSFLNVVIHRLPRMIEQEWREQCAELSPACGDATPPRINLATPRSACPRCGHAITALENIPLVSYLLLRGRCSACGARISPRYPVVELLGGLFGIAAVAHFGLGTAGVSAAVLLWALLALTAIDLDTQLLPDAITLPLLWGGLAVNLFGTHAALGDAVVGAMAGYLSLWSVYWAFRLTTGKEGMGYGDFKLLAALGAWLGWQMLPLVILLSSLVGAAVGIALMIGRRLGRDVPIPFGPYLAAAGAIALFWGDAIIGWYLGT